MNYINRKIAQSVPTKVQLVKISDHEYSWNTMISVVTHRQKFIPGTNYMKILINRFLIKFDHVTGQEKELTTIEGRKVKSTFRIEGHILIEDQIETNREVTLIREFYDKEFLGTSIVSNITCKNRGVLEEWIGSSMNLCSAHRFMSFHVFSAR